MRIAIAKGRILTEVMPLLRRAGLDTRALAAEGRSLIRPIGEGLEAMIVRSQDVPIFVERGAAALGLTGLDTLRERGSNLYELCDLGIGRCRLSIAGPAGLDLAADPNRRWRVASKYPVLTAAAFRAAGRCAEILKLGGTLETVPESGLADCIVDLVETGRTLKTHGLVELEVILEVTTRVVSAPSTYVRHHATIAPLVRRLMEAAP